MRWRTGSQCNFIIVAVTWSRGWRPLTNRAAAWRMKAVMHHRHELELHSFRHVESMKVDMHKLSQTVIELSYITNKISRRIEEMLHLRRKAINLQRRSIRSSSGLIISTRLIMIVNLLSAITTCDGICASCDSYIFISVDWLWVGVCVVADGSGMPERKCTLTGTSDAILWVFFLTQYHSVDSVVMSICRSVRLSLWRLKIISLDDEHITKVVCFLAHHVECVLLSSMGRLPNDIKGDFLHYR